jgi:molecular chaperone GrpE
MTDQSIAPSLDPQLPPITLPEQELVTDTPVVLPDPYMAVEQITEIIQQLQADFQAKIQYDQSKERLIDSLHRELQGYREDLVFKILSPLVNDLVQLYDDVDKVTARKTGDADGDAVRDELRDHVLSDIESILERYGFDLYQTTDTLFDRKLHRVTRIMNTSEEALDLTIAEHGRRGLRYGERIVRPENVVVYQYKIPPTAESV